MAAAEGRRQMQVPKVSVKQVTDFPVDSSLFEVHGKVVDLDSPTQERKPGVRALPFGNLLSMAAVLQDKDGCKITVEAQSKDRQFLQSVCDKLQLDNTVRLYRPMVTSCR